MNTYEFVKESNRIEGIKREPTKAEIDAHDEFIDFSQLSIEAICKLVSVYQPDAKLRTETGMNVRVGNHYPPRGGMHIQYQLEALLSEINDGGASPYKAHCEYETLHPFTDGNGRSGRVVWAWMMFNQHNGYPLGFLHHFYYQALQAIR